MGLLLVQVTQYSGRPRTFTLTLNLPYCAPRVAVPKRPSSGPCFPCVWIRVFLAHLRASGKGWQTKVNALLRQAVEQGKM